MEKWWNNDQQGENVFGEKSASVPLCQPITSPEVMLDRTVHSQKPAYICLSYGTTYILRYSH
jgi:hypothetical protein